MTLKFYNHADLVAACEQLADDLTDFETNSVELEIKVRGKLSDSTKEWVSQVASIED